MTTSCTNTPFTSQHSVTNEDPIAELQRNVAASGYKALTQGKSDGWTVLHEAARDGNMNIIQAVFQKCAGRPELLSLKTTKGLIPLHTAVCYDQIITAHTLMSFGSPINLKTMDLLTRIFSLALSQDINVETGATPLDIALRIQNESMICLLRLNGGQCALPHSISEISQLKKADNLIAEKGKMAAEMALKLEDTVAIPKEPLRIIMGYAIHYMIEFYS